MKINWKILIASVLIVLVALWAFDSIRSRSYSGTELTFAVGHGVLTLTNSSSAAVPVQLVGAGTRGFTVTSSIDGVGGASIREGTGRAATQLFGFDLSQGVTTLNVVSASAVNFVVSSTTVVEATAQPQTSSETSTTLLIAAVATLGLVFYISSATGHHLIKSFLPQRPVETIVPPVVPVRASQPMRAYGDNRADITEK